MHALPSPCQMFGTWFSSTLYPPFTEQHGAPCCKLETAALGLASWWDSISGHLPKPMPQHGPLCQSGGPLGPAVFFLCCHWLFCWPVWASHWEKQRKGATISGHFILSFSMGSGGKGNWMSSSETVGLFKERFSSEAVNRLTAAICLFHTQTDICFTNYLNGLLLLCLLGLPAPNTWRFLE